MSHFTLIPLDNYKTRNPLSLVVSGFSPFMELSRTPRGQFGDSSIPKEFRTFHFISIFFLISDYLLI